VQIIVSRDAIEQMTSQFAKTWQRQPTGEEQKGLVEDLVRNEIFYREAVAIGLDRDDEALKRRLRQKMEFIYEDIASVAEPTDEDLKAFMKMHREKYLADPQISFRQVYISIDKRGKRADSDAQEVLAQLRSGVDPASAGDPTLLEADAALSPLWDIRKQFGDEFSKSLMEIKAGKWAGPVRSAFGLHLVFVNKRRDGRLPILDDVRETVKRDWLVERQKELKDAAYTKIRERYAVTVEGSKSPAAPLPATADAKVMVR
jgi:parvulin-like peptidyl-prolyl isomerase